jgi:hypothetical protein
MDKARADRPTILAGMHLHFGPAKGDQQRGRGPAKGSDQQRGRKSFLLTKGRKTEDGKRDRTENGTGPIK